MLISSPVENSVYLWDINKPRHMWHSEGPGAFYNLTMLVFPVYPSLSALMDAAFTEDLIILSL